MELAEWLRSLGLEQYEATFRDNAIDETVLRDLSEDHLRELGFPLGVRIKLLKAIASLGEAAAPIGPSARLAPTCSPVDAGERRQVTVMFSDLVGSTALSARMDPEDLREVISAYQRCVAEPVHRLGGFIAKYLGDGVLVYFGYPQAHEDDAERAVRAGLELIAAVSSLASPVLLQTRVGIATGVVVVGDLIGSGDAQQRGIVGETPNLAARLQGIAEPNAVVIAEGTRKLLGNLFELQDLGAKELKGIAGPVRAWAALRARSVEGRFEALHAAGQTALVGRDEERELLLRRWTRAKGGEGQVVLLSGEAGIGKSRLTAALLEHLAGEPHARLRYFCSPQHTDSAFFPIIGQIERAAGLRHDDTAQAKLDKLDAVLAPTMISKGDAALLADLLSLPNDGRYPRLDSAPQQRRQKTLEVLSLQLEALSRSRPVLMVFEDVHWIDPTSLEALGRAVERIAGLRVLLIVTHRPEFVPPWIGQPHVTALTINRLAQRDIVAMIDRVVGDKVLLASVRRDIMERTDGIPLFVEEMTKAVLEADNESAALRTAAAVPSPVLAVPASLHASLMARLDRLGPAREVAQIGAVIGREFSHALLAAVVRKPEAELDAALDRLVAAGLLFRQGVPPDANYWFKHALVQDAAYGTLLREPRRALHARIAEVLERQFDDIAESQPELLARHCTEAGLIEKAASLWGKAGQRALARSALKEAAEQLARALGQIAALPGNASLRREQVRLQINLANALIHTKGHASPETRASFEQARVLIERADALGEPADDPLALFSVMYGFWVGSRMAFNGDVALELATQFQELAQRQRGTAPLMIGELLMGISLVLVGDLAEGRARLDRAIALYDPSEHRSLATRFGHDVRVSALAWRALASWMLGYPEAAVRDVEHALGDAREIGHAATSMFALSHTSLALILCGRHAAGGALADDLVALAESKGTSYWKSYGLLLRGWLLVLTGRAADAVSAAPAAIAAMRSTGATAYAPWYMSYLAEAYAELARFDDAGRCLAEAMTGVESSKERWCEAEVHRIAGEMALRSPNSDAAQAEAHFARALSVARGQNAKSFELRAATSLARLWYDQGKRDAARDVLAPVRAWFTEGADTADLRAAKVLLDTLAS
jgi:class 3 adenylate cyclase/predicted ATPase